ncbi:sulfurtransferase [Halomonas caseinilytica]|uniref:Thiosulfate/3-mercaptopyruvate sulfurtransferase n=1 Tax=Halomonas caseinilytica TaxID=438744 RepID=A0A1M6XDF1_9GAMM|nr:sulfurtransferase [Halomonas caseinilytica]SHL03972.1 thiosulfate/3-mercaptopyruvate sulfurtransferase [Halomonas caseinilytica]
MSDVLIGAEALRHWLSEPQTPVVLDCRARLGEPEAGARLWREGHVPTSRHLDLDRDLASSPGVRGRHPLPAPAAFAATLRRLGVEPGRPVVVYDDTGGQLAAARAWWMLARWAGHPDVRVLDGGLPAWQKAGGSLEEGEKAPAAASDWAPAFDDDTWVEADEVFSSRALKLDARSRERFRGEHEPVDALAGHIPGAFCRPSADNLGESGCFKSPTALREALPEASDVISYCGSGVTACHNILAHAVAGLPLPKLYVGSWSEWIRDPARPIATGD